MIIAFFRLTLFLVLFTVGCTRSQEEHPGTLNIAVESYPEQLDPRKGQDALSSKINKLIYNGLFKTNEALEVVPDLAEFVHQISSTEFDIFIKKGVLFHDGTPLTAKDVKATYQSLLDPKVGSPHKGVFEEIESVDVVDDYSLHLKLKKPFAPILTALSLGILPEKIIHSDFKAVGTGPYRLESQIKNSKIVLQAFGDHFGQKPFNQHLVFQTVYDDTLRTLEFLKGRIDLVQNAIPPALIPVLEGHSPLWFLKQEAHTILKETGINVSYMGINMKDPTLSNAKVRQALAHGINRKEILQYQLRGMGTEASSLLHPKHWAFDIDLKPIEYNPELSKKLLDEAGFPDPDGDGPKPRLSLTYKTSSKKDRVDMALLIAKQFSAIGIQVDVASYEWGTFFRDIRTGNFQIFTLTWVGVTEPDIYYYALHSSQIPPTGANRGEYINPAMDALLDKGRATLEPDARRDIYKKVQELALADLPFIPLWYETNVAAIGPKMKDYQLRTDAGFQNLSQTRKLPQPKP